jgi:YVTN family beta-propeller protein
MRRALLFSTVVLLSVVAAASAASLRRIAMLDVPGRPGFDSAVFANGALLLSHAGTNTVDIFDTTKRRMIASVKDLDNPHGIAASDKTGRVYIANSGDDTITVLSSRDWKVEEQIQLNDSPYALALSPDGKQLYSANWQDRSVTMLDLSRGERQTTVSVDGAPSNILFEPTRGRLYVALQDRGEIVVLDPSLRPLKQLKLDASQPTGLAVDASGSKLFVSVRFAVLALDTESGTELGRIAAPGGVDELWYDGQSGNLYAASEGFVTIVQTNGGLRALEEVKTDVKGHTLAYDAAKGLVYMPGGHEGKGKLLILKHVDGPQQEPQQVAEKK